MTALPRLRRLVAAAAVVGGLIACSPDGRSDGVLGARLPRVTPDSGEDCRLVVDRLRPPSLEAGRVRTIQEAVDRARPGDSVCVASREHGDERVLVTRSGTPAAPIRIRALGEVLTGGFAVEADYVALEGFRIEAQPGEGRPGVRLAGSGLAVTDNLVLDPTGTGIGCTYAPPGCPGAVIQRNRVHGADGTGIVARGDGILVADNDISGSRMVTANDADGIRFFGRDITIRGNYVHHISDAGFPPGEEPHTDCFQTFDNHKPPTRDVLIEGNVCIEVDHQCLIVEAPSLGQSARIVFRGNLCANRGSQGVLIRDVPGVEIRDNLFLPSIVYAGVVLRQGATDATVAGNTFLGAIEPYTVDRSSRQGFRAARNKAVPAVELETKILLAGPAGRGMAGRRLDHRDVPIAVVAWRRAHGIACPGDAVPAPGRSGRVTAAQAAAALLCPGHSGVGAG